MVVVVVVLRCGEGGMRGRLQAAAFKVHLTEWDPSLHLRRRRLAAAEPADHALGGVAGSFAQAAPPAKPSHVRKVKDNRVRLLGGGPNRDARLQTIDEALAVSRLRSHHSIRTSPTLSRTLSRTLVLPRNRAEIEAYGAFA